MQVLRYAAFTVDPNGGNPAGVVLDAAGADDAEMQRAAFEVGYSETAFLTPTGPGTAAVRYFAPAAEIAFCGHATIAAAVALAERGAPGRLVLDSRAGEVVVESGPDPDDAAALVATLVSVPPSVTDLPPGASSRLLAALRLRPADLDPDLPLRVAFAGNYHPLVPVTALALDDLDHDDDALRALMAEQGWGATVQVVARLGPDEFEARNPFPPGGVREDPATGSAAAALGAYLRALGLVDPPARIRVHQGRHVGRPGLLTVDIPPGDAGIAVSGRAVAIG